MQSAVQSLLQSTIRNMADQQIYFGLTNQTLQGLVQAQHNKTFISMLQSYSNIHSHIEWKTDFQTLIDEPVLIQLCNVGFKTVSIWLPCNEHTFVPNGKLYAAHWQDFIQRLHDHRLSVNFHVVLSIDRAVIYSSTFLNDIIELKDKLFPIQLSIELENRSWKNPTALKIFRGAKLNIIQRDMPSLSGFSFALPTFDPKHYYIRLLGRNKVDWFSLESSRRYHYDYNASELKELATKIKQLKEEYEHIYIVSNTQPATIAVSNIYQLAYLYSKM